MLTGWLSVRQILTQESTAVFQPTKNRFQGRLKRKNKLGNNYGACWTNRPAKRLQTDQTAEDKTVMPKTETSKPKIKNLLNGNFSLSLSLSLSFQKNPERPEENTVSETKPNRNITQNPHHRNCNTNRTDS